ncbi:hypothetical protein O181_071323 [Austropuccinia psidii MF-1]|uniref:DDE Tnp4 domain-containing protein n=1 Tax=Austropuccinia psidii MF-1 TaxID=1389203 RepID=A0A9Q3I832_9BASI|nr:hypothetical protein [Austropuccinia psidii MF-1]
MALEHLGSNGNGASIGRLARTYQISRGAVVNVTRRVIGALFSLGFQFLQWPNQAMREEISNDMASEGFLRCVGFLDGTTIPLFQQPGIDREVFYDQKKQYSLNVKLVFDSRKQIIGLLSGFPGSCGDIAVYKRMGIYLCPHDFFDRGKYLLSDLAYPLRPNLIPCYKGTAAERHDNQLFNNYISHSRVQIEHCVGILKAQWALLRNLRLLCNLPEHMFDINRWIYVFAVLHNILIDKGKKWDLFYAPKIRNNKVQSDLRADSLEALDHCQDVQMACLQFHGDI